MYEDAVAKLVDFDQPLRQGLIARKMGRVTVAIDLSEYTEEEKREIGNLLGENGCNPSQRETYMGIPFEFESRLKPFCPVRSA